MVKKWSILVSSKRGNSRQIALNKGQGVVKKGSKRGQKGSKRVILDPFLDPLFWTFFLGFFMFFVVFIFWSNGSRFFSLFIFFKKQVILVSFDFYKNEWFFDHFLINFWSIFGHFYVFKAGQKSVIYA